MGKRGNMVQAYASMEYRFFPELLRVTTDDVVCFVWSGKAAFSYMIKSIQSNFFTNRNFKICNVTKV